MSVTEPTYKRRYLGNKYKLQCETKIVKINR